MLCYASAFLLFAVYLLTASALVSFTRFGAYGSASPWHLAHDLNSLCEHGSKQFIELSHKMLSRLSTLLCVALRSVLQSSLVGFQAVRHAFTCNIYTMVLMFARCPVLPDKEHLSSDCTRLA